MNPQARSTLQALRPRLHQLAFSSMRYGLQHNRPLPVELDDWPESLQAHGASFVSLHLAGALRGCIGSIEARRPLIEDIAANACAAALRDPRFPAVSAEEIIDLELSISVLGTPRRIDIESQQDLLECLRPNQDGLILGDGLRRAVFLPQVWEQLPRPADFVLHLLLKAGLPTDLEPPALQAWLFDVHAL